MSLHESALEYFRMVSEPQLHSDYFNLIKIFEKGSYNNTNIRVDWEENLHQVGESVSRRSRTGKSPVYEKLSAAPSDQ